MGYSPECLDNCEACTDPCTYCKFRQAWVIWELCGKSEKRSRLEKVASGELGIYTEIGADVSRELQAPSG
jgi:hypothetical protein